ncbi:MAG: O-antigen polymerase [Fuerstiella sp.]
MINEKPPWFISLLRITIGFSVAITIALSYWVSGDAQEFILGFMGAACLLVTAAPLFLRNDYDLFEPATLVMLLVWFGVPFRIVYLIAAQDTDPHVADHVLFYQQPTAFLYGVFVVLVGLMFFAGGYALKLRIPAIHAVYLPSMTRWNTRRLELILLVIGGISMICLVAFILSAGVNFSSLSTMSEKRFNGARDAGSSRVMSPVYYLYRGAALSKFVVYFGLVSLLTEKKKLVSWTGLWVLLFLFQTTLLSVILDSRASVILLFVDCMILYFFVKRTFSIRLACCSLALALGLTIPMLASRSSESGETPLQGIVQKTFTGRNMLDIAKTCHVINGVPSKMDFRYGQMLYGWMFAPVPRSIMPNKPDWSNQGVYLNQEIFGFDGDLSGCPPGLIGELYWDFGLGGVWIGLFIFGFIFRQLHITFRMCDYSPASVLIYTIIISRFVMFSLGNDLGTGIVKAILDLAPIYATLLIIGKWRTSAHSS